MKHLLLIPFALAADLPCDFKFTMGTDPNDSTRLKYEVSLPENTWFGVAYGNGMYNTDLGRFVGGDGGSVEDLWGSGYFMPSQDS